MLTKQSIPAIILSLVLGMGIGYLAKSTMSSSKISSDDDKINYSLGIQFAKTLMDHNIPVIPQALVQGMKDMAEQNERFSPQELANMRQLTSNKINQKTTEEFSANKKIGDAFLEKNKNDRPVKVLPSGVQLEVVSEGGGKTPTINSTVFVKLLGRLIDGKVFEDRRDQGLTFGVKDSLPGLQDGLLRMKEGGKYIVYIPSELGTASQNTKVIRAGAVLIYEVELVRAN